MATQIINCYLIFIGFLDHTGQPWFGWRGNNSMNAGSHRRGSFLTMSGSPLKQRNHNFLASSTMEPLSTLFSTVCFNQDPNEFHILWFVIISLKPLLNYRFLLPFFLFFFSSTLRFVCWTRRGLMRCKWGNMGNTTNMMQVKLGLELADMLTSCGWERGPPPSQEDMIEHPGRSSTSGHWWEVLAPGCDK